MNKKLYCIALLGCHDETAIEMELTQEEAELVRRISAATVEESSYCCMPTLVITTVKGESTDEER